MAKKILQAIPKGDSDLQIKAAKAELRAMRQLLTNGKEVPMRPVIYTASLGIIGAQSHFEIEAFVKPYIPLSKNSRIHDTGALKTNVLLHNMYIPS